MVHFISPLAYSEEKSYLCGLNMLLPLADERMKKIRRVLADGV